MLLNLISKWFSHVNTVQDVIIQAIGVIGLILVVISFQNNRRQLILIFLGSAQVFFAIHFALLGAWTASAMNIVGATRTFLFTQKGKKKWMDSKVWILVFVGLFWIAGVVSWDGWIGILPVLGMSIETVGLWLKNPTRIRFANLLPRPLWFTYNIIYHSYAGMLTETFLFISISLGIFRFDFIPRIKEKRNNKNRE